MATNNKKMMVNGWSNRMRQEGEKYDNLLQETAGLKSFVQFSSTFKVNEANFLTKTISCPQNNYHKQYDRVFN